MELRNRVLIYDLERGAGQPKGYVPLDEMKRELDLQRDEYRAVYLSLYQAGLAHTNATSAAIYLTDDPGRSPAFILSASNRLASVRGSSASRPAPGAGTAQ